MPEVSLLVPLLLVPLGVAAGALLVWGLAVRPLLRRVRLAEVHISQLDRATGAVARLPVDGSPTGAPSFQEAEVARLRTRLAEQEIDHSAEVAALLRRLQKFQDHERGVVAASTQTDAVQALTGPDAPTSSDSWSLASPAGSRRPPGEISDSGTWSTARPAGSGEQPTAELPPGDEYR